MIYVFDDYKGRVDFNALITALKSSCWGWLD